MKHENVKQAIENKCVTENHQILCEREGKVIWVEVKDIESSDKFIEIDPYHEAVRGC